MAVPLVTALRPGPSAAPGPVAAALARSLAPPEAGDTPPGWLRAGQAVAFRRALFAARRHGGTLVADPPGSGKTWVGLAVGEALRRAGSGKEGALTCLVPAALRSQWRDVLRRTGIAATIVSHEMASRGRLPAGSGPVVVDESHRFRNPGTKRYRHVAPWVVGRPLVLLTATPVVNCAADLGHQLRLGVRDDALAARGLPSLLAPGEGEAGALGSLVVARDEVAGLPALRSRRQIPPAPDPDTSRLLAGLDRLRLSTDAGVASLLRTGLLRALASSPSAFAGALARYRALLLQAGDAAAAGRVAGRRALRALGGGECAQLVIWELLPRQPEAEWELALEDAGELRHLALEARRAAEGPDPRAEALAALVADGRPTIVFTAFRETARALRERLGRVAWVTGDGAGIGRLRAARAAVLAPFRRTEGPEGREPGVLLATDVAAEGLDLRGVARVVHHDLPWTPVRLVQRAGRARRLDARHGAVEVVTLAAPPGVEARLGLPSTLARKGRLAERLVDAPEWRWGAALAERAADGPAPIEGVAVVTVPSAEEAGVLAGIVIEDPGEEDGARTGWIGWRPAGSGAEGWLTSRSVVAPRVAALLEAGGRPAGPAVDPTRLAAITRDVARTAARLLHRAAVSRLSAPIRAPGAAALRRWLLREAAAARRARDSARLRRIDAWLHFLARGHTAGESRLIEGLGAGGGLRLLAGHPPTAPEPAPREPGGAPRVRLSGIVVFDSEGC